MWLKRLHAHRLVSAMLLVLSCSGTFAGEETPTRRLVQKRRWYDPRRYVEQGRECIDGVCRLEIVEMLTALAHGQPPDEGQGWFHEGESRYGWQWLAQRYDRNADGLIEPDEFSSEQAELLAALDRDESGKIEKEDFDWSSKSPFVKQMSQTRRLFGPIDRDRNGQITRQEWRDFFERTALDADAITPADLQAMLFPPEPSQDSPTPLDFLRGFASGELGSIYQGPAVGSRAPDFELSDYERKRSIRLSQFQGQKPVVLIFGSFT